MEIYIVAQGWKQIIARAMRFQGSDTPVVPDHLYINFVEDIKQVINKSVTVSDHNIIGVHIKTKEVKCPPQAIKMRDFRYCDWEAFRVEFSMEVFHDIHQQQQPDLML